MVHDVIDSPLGALRSRALSFAYTIAGGGAAKAVSELIVTPHDLQRSRQKGLFG